VANPLAHFTEVSMSGAKKFRIFGFFPKTFNSHLADGLSLSVNIGLTTMRKSIKIILRRLLKKFSE
jgi:hypothetical protein